MHKMRVIINHLSELAPMAKKHGLSNLWCTTNFHKELDTWLDAIEDHEDGAEERLAELKTIMFPAAE